MYDLTSLVKVNSVAGLIGVTLETRLGNEVLGVIDVSMGHNVRDGYKIAMRTLRLRQQGFKLELARDYAKEAQKNPSIGQVAMMHQFAEKEGMDFFEYLVRISAMKGGVQ